MDLLQRRFARRQNLPKPVKLAGLEMQSRDFWLTSADRFLVEIAAPLMARYRFSEIKSGDASQFIGLLGKIGFSPKDRMKGRMLSCVVINDGYS